MKETSEIHEMCEICGRGQGRGGDIEGGHGGTWGGYAPLNFLNNTSVHSSGAGVTFLCQEILFYKSYLMQMSKNI